MNEYTVIQNGSVYTPTRVIADGVVVFNTDGILAVGRRGEVHNYSIGHNKVIDATDAIVTPGFIEVHTHGGGGFALHTTDPEEMQAYARWITSTGVTSFLVAIVGTPDSLPVAQLQTAVDVIENYRATSASNVGAEPLGIFLEGPYINVERRG